MKLSILPVFVVVVFAFCIVIVRRGRSNASITGAQASSVYALLGGLAVWTAMVVLMGLSGAHLQLMAHVPLLWQALVVVVLWSSAFLLSPKLREGLRGLAVGTPSHWLIFFQALRIGALGGVLKGLRGEIGSSYVFWVGIPDFLFGVSALLLGWLTLRKAVRPGLLILWNLVGFSLIVFPTFLASSHWMHEEGFSFIFEFPMILAPAMVVSTFVSLNLLHAWGLAIQASGSARESQDPVAGRSLA